MTGFEPATLGLGSRYSTAELHPLISIIYYNITNMETQEPIATCSTPHNVGYSSILAQAEKCEIQVWYCIAGMIHTIPTKANTTTSLEMKLLLI